MTTTEYRAPWLRSVERLRCGLPPANAASRISVGTTPLSTAFTDFLANPRSHGYVVLGDYGAGKSHALTLLRDLSLEAGFATCWLTADGFDCALNHPQRFLASLLGTLETPLGDGGYAAFLARVLELPELRSRMITEVADAFSGSSALDLQVRQLLWALAQPTGVMAARDPLAYLTLIHDHLIRLLVGDTLTGAGGHDGYRLVAYRVLALAVRLTTVAGTRGLVIVIDEVESIFSKLCNIRSRYGAFRVLSALLHGLAGPGLRVAIAITPDANLRLSEELSAAAGHFSSLVCEPVRTLSRSLDAGTIPTWRCRPLSDVQFRELFENIRQLYADAYPDVVALPDVDWLQTTREIGMRQRSTRLAIRDLIDHLDRGRFGVI